MIAFSKDTLTIDNGHRIVFLLVASDDADTAITGIAPTVQISVNGGSFAAAAGTPAEIGSGWYYIDLTAGEVDTAGPLIVKAYHASSKVWSNLYEVIAADPDVNVASIDSAVTANANVKTYDATFDGSNLLFDATALEQIAVYLARYDLADVEAGAQDTVGGVTMPTFGFQSLAGAIARLVNDWETDDVAGTMTIYLTDGTTTLATMTIGLSETAKPITAATLQ